MCHNYTAAFLEQFSGLKNAATPDHIQTTPFNLPNKVSPNSLPDSVKADSTGTAEGPSKNFRDSSRDPSCCLFQPKDKNGKRKKKRKVQLVEFPGRRYHLSQHIHSLETSNLFSVKKCERVVISVRHNKCALN